MVIAGLGNALQILFKCPELLQRPDHDGELHACRHSINRISGCLRGQVAG